MKFFAAAAIGLLPVFALAPAEAAVPHPVIALLGPGIGYLLAHSDLCQWDMNAQIKTTYQDAFNAMGLTAAQQAAVWQEAAAREQALDNLPEAAKAGMKSGTCSADFRARMEADLTP